MSHSYPLASDARAALGSDSDGARTREEARNLLKGRRLVGLKSDWVTLSTVESADAAKWIERGVDQGYIQRYEDAAGNIVLAITFWAVAEDVSGAADVADPPKSGEKPDKETRRPDDHTDDLYFRAGRTKTRKRKHWADPNQMDLFGTPEDTKTAKTAQED